MHIMATQNIERPRKLAAEAIARVIL